jgi:hypothetical protein
MKWCLGLIAILMLSNVPVWAQSQAERVEVRSLGEDGANIKRTLSSPCENLKGFISLEDSSFDSCRCTAGPNATSEQVDHDRLVLRNFTFCRYNKNAVGLNVTEAFPCVKIPKSCLDDPEQPNGTSIKAKREGTMKDDPVQPKTESSHVNCTLRASTSDGVFYPEPRSWQDASKEFCKTQCLTAANIFCKRNSEYHGKVNCSFWNDGKIEETPYLCNPISAQEPRACWIGAKFVGNLTLEQCCKSKQAGPVSVRWYKNNGHNSVNLNENTADCSSYQNADGPVHPTSNQEHTSGE